MDYKIIYAYSMNRTYAVDFLTKDVQKHIEMGWKPQGGVSIATEVYDGELWFTICQAMIKELV